jgi:hypothetical protein
MVFSSISDDDGRRARSRLQAVLVFGFSRTDSGLAVRARALANPAAAPSIQLAEFAPIPRLVVVGETADGVTMNYLDELNRPLAAETLGAWSHVP